MIAVLVLLTLIHLSPLSLNRMYIKSLPICCVSRQASVDLESVSPRLQPYLIPFISSWIL